MSPIYASPTRPAGNHSGSSSHQYSTLDVLDHSAWIRAVVKFDMSTIAGPSSPRLGKLEAGTVSGARVCPEDSAIGREASPGSSVLTTRSVVLRLCRLSVPTELVSSTVVVPRDGAHLSSVSRGRTTSTTRPLMRRMPVRTASKVSWRFQRYQQSP